MPNSKLRGRSRWSSFGYRGLWAGALGLLAAWSGACGREETANPAARTVAPAAAPSPALGFFTVTLCRVLDTRTPGQGPALTSGKARQLTIAGKCGIPATAVSVAVNVTAVDPTDDGSLSFYPNPSSQPPTASALSFTRGRKRANNTLLTLNTVQKDGTVQAMPAMQHEGAVDLLIDVNGYFAPGAAR
ncbi:MAG TPA: hypothetical protein VHQ90_17690 [Thermoanaerobaculia bacterium]|nr:hypothetical protein [Thermoanaerobaculia bacterium]